MVLGIGDFCKLTFLLKPPGFDEKNKYNVITCSLFRMKQGYKNFKRYTSGLEFAIPFFTKKIPNSYFLLYIDKSITDSIKIFKRILNMNNGKLIIVKYTCPKYIESGYHKELFGSLVRFLPMFEHEGNFTKDVICTDADVGEVDAKRLVTDYRIFSNISSKYHYDTNMFYEILSKWALKNDYSIMAGRHMSKYKFPLNLLTAYTDYIKNIKHDAFNYEKYSQYPYGVDELFLNNFLLKYIKENNITYSISIRYVITAPLYYVISKEMSSDAQELLVKNMQKILNDYRSNNYKDLVQKFDEVFFPYIYGGREKIKDSAKIIAQNYHNFILDSLRKKDYSIFQKQTLKKIASNRDYIMNHIVIIHYKNNKIRKYLSPNYIKL